MLMFALIASVFAQCPLKKQLPSKVTQIKYADLPVLLEQSKGCVTLFEIWASWCGPCKSLKPRITALLKKHPDVLFLNISVDKQKSKLQSYLQQNRYSSVGRYLLLDGKGAELYKVLPSNMPFRSSIPFVVLLDQKGEVLASATSVLDVERLGQALDKLKQK